MCSKLKYKVNFKNIQFLTDPISVCGTDSQYGGRARGSSTAATLSVNEVSHVLISGANHATQFTRIYDWYEHTRGNSRPSTLYIPYI